MELEHKPSHANCEDEDDSLCISQLVVSEKAPAEPPKDNKIVDHEPLPHFTKSQAFSHLQQQGWKNLEMMDPVFDEDGVPFSPNPNMYQMWLRHYQQQAQDGVNASNGDGVDVVDARSDKKVQVSPANRFPGFQFRPCPSGSGGGDVVYDDGSGPPLSATGTWVLDQNDTILSSSTRMPPSRESQLLTMPPLFTRMLELHGIRNRDVINKPQLERRTRNRFYSDSQDMEDLSTSSSSCKPEDSGIAVELEEMEELPATPSADEFKPPLNSTPNPALQNYSVSIFYRRLLKYQQNKEAKEKAVKEDADKSSDKPKSPVKL